MASDINVNLPSGPMATTASVRANFAAAKSEIEALQTGKAPLASPTFTGTVTIPAGASINGFAPLASPALSGTPTAPTAAQTVNNTQIATTAFARTYADGRANTINNLQGRSVPNTAPTTGQVLTWNGSAWVPSDITPTGPAVGEWVTFFSTGTSTHIFTIPPGSDGVRAPVFGGDTSILGFGGGSRLSIRPERMFIYGQMGYRNLQIGNGSQWWNVDNGFGSDSFGTLCFIYRADSPPYGVTAYAMGEGQSSWVASNLGADVLYMRLSSGGVQNIESRIWMQTWIPSLPS